MGFTIRHFHNFGFAKLTIGTMFSMKTLFLALFVASAAAQHRVLKGPSMSQPSTYSGSMAGPTSPTGGSGSMYGPTSPTGGSAMGPTSPTGGSGSALKSGGAK